MTPEDLIFLIRKDSQKVHRLQEFLSWKDVRKNVKNSEETEVLVEDGKSSLSMIDEIIYHHLFIIRKMIDGIIYHLFIIMIDEIMIKC